MKKINSRIFFYIHQAASSRWYQFFFSVHKRCGKKISSKMNGTRGWGWGKKWNGEKKYKNVQRKTKLMRIFSTFFPFTVQKNTTTKEKRNCFFLIDCLFVSAENLHPKTINKEMEEKILLLDSNKRNVDFSLQSRVILQKIYFYDELLFFVILNC